MNLGIPFANRSVFAALLLSTASTLLADVPNVSGTMSSVEYFDHYGGRASTISFQLSGTNFALTGNIGLDHLLNFGSGKVLDSTGTPATAIFNPTVARTVDAPYSVFAPPAFSSLSFTYNGTTYTNVQVTMNFAGAPATVPSSYASCSCGFYGGSVSNVPFTMTALVSAYAAPPATPNTPSGAPIISVAISGGGNYNAAGVGAAPGSGTVGVNASATYQLFANPTAFTTDATTQGAWNGAYGGDGFLLANGPSYVPSYVAANVSGASSYTWAPQTLDPRALQSGLNATSQMAAAYTANNFNINLNFTDGLSHRVSLYLLDYDTSTRSETITIRDANSAAILDTETISNFHNGLYATWNLQGAVTINVKTTAGASAVISGIFFGPPGVLLTPPIKSFTEAKNFTVDKTTQGTWLGRYGSAGYTIANGPSSTSNALVSGAINYTWAGQTSDPRALQSNPGGTNRIASAFTQYPGSSFKINVYVPSGQTQRVALYLLDWDNAGRTEKITITDLSTGAVLDTQTVSGFQNGQYASWVITGSAVLTITPVGSSSPVVSGIFFN